MMILGQSVKTRMVGQWIHSFFNCFV